MDGVRGVQTLTNLAEVKDQEPHSPVWREVIRTYGLAYAGAESPRPRLQEMAEAIDEAAAALAAGQRAAKAAYGHDFDPKRLRQTVALHAARDLIERILTEVHEWPKSAQRIIAGK